MTDIVITKIRRHILEAASGHSGVPESKYARHDLDAKAVAFLIEQQMLERRLGDGKSAMIWRLHITERGRAGLRGDILTKI